MVEHPATPLQAALPGTPNPCFRVGDFSGMWILETRGFAGGQALLRHRYQFLQFFKPIQDYVDLCANGARIGSYHPRQLDPHDSVVARRRAGARGLT